MAFFLPFSGHALTSQTTRNAIQGSAPYLTFDGGRTRVVDTSGLLGITLSDGTQYTPSTNPSYSSRPIVLPGEGQSFADIGMLVPTDTNSVDLSSLIGPPNNYWGDDDGDSGVTATGSLSLSIVDKSGQSVSRSTVLEICKAPYKVTLSSTDGTLSTRYGVPNSRAFHNGYTTYYINPKAAPIVCFAVSYSSSNNGTRPSSMWDPRNGFIPQSTDPSSYGRNFPTTGLNGLYFDLLISGSSQPLSWSPVSQGGITVTMSNSTATSVRVTLTGPYATKSQQNSSSPDGLPSLSLPQTFELVGRDTNGTPVVKYGFTLKQWFVNRGNKQDTYPNTLSWCNSIGYRVPKVKDLTNASCQPGYQEDWCRGSVGATPSSDGNFFQRYIGAGFSSEWGSMHVYSGAGFEYNQYYRTSDPYSDDGRYMYLVGPSLGDVLRNYATSTSYGICVYP
ncbi:hypothetical protein [Gilliamella sp. B3367]|uniref:hypothetical protein n=1 Tax=Gilliamella sp. B3367 TaxID=2817989 RepID=UPI00226AED0C|nr:hypothetical protein [Gilliamella sp. B3367]MCX8595678.1 hypothetical protein [Gilliamella sp. B3367]